VLDRDKFEAIVELIDNQGRQFERTPTAFQALSEEALRNIILSSLNAVFEGAAVGEAFQGVGKADIYLRISQGQVFVAEVKIWDGPASLAEVVAQLLGSAPTSLLRVSRSRATRRGMLKFTSAPTISTRPGLLVGLPNLRDREPSITFRSGRRPDEWHAQQASTGQPKRDGDHEAHQRTDAHRQLTMPVSRQRQPTGEGKPPR